MAKKILTAAVILLNLAAVAYLATGYVLYNTLADIAGRCDDERVNNPARFDDVNGGWDEFNFDFTPYWMSAFESVTFPSRDAGFSISGWYVETDPAAPAVILTHGLGSCKYNHTVLTPAGMLARNGFNVLLIDVRDAGDSTFEDGRSAIGNEEYLDLLGAWDWLQAEKGQTPERIGIFGNSLGAATTLIAFAQEPEVAAVFVDSPFDNLPQIIREELDRENYPQFLYTGGIWMAWLAAGDNVVAYNPYEALDLAAGRPLYFVHGTADGRIGVHHTRQLQERAGRLESNASFWIVDGVDHVQAAAIWPEEYERRLAGFFEAALSR